jgi:transposase
MPQRRTYTKEFKREAVALLLSSGRSVTEVAKELGIERVNLFRWKREQEEGSLQGTAPSGPESEELRKLRRQVAQLQQERDFLKKAVGFFARESD